MKILFDTNIVLDVLLKREPFADIAIDLLSAVENSIIQGYLCATTLTTIDYLISKANGNVSAKKAIGYLLELFEVAEVNKTILETAVNSDFSDFEDAVLYFSGVGSGIDGFVTRNIKDFKTAEIPIFKPIELISVVNQMKNNQQHSR